MLIALIKVYLTFWMCSKWHHAHLHSGGLLCLISAYPNYFAIAKLKWSLMIINGCQTVVNNPVKTVNMTGCQIRIFLRESNGFSKLHRLGVLKKFWGFMLCLDVLAPHFHGETPIPKCISCGNLLKKIGCTDPQLPLIWQPDMMIFPLLPWDTFEAICLTTWPQWVKSMLISDFTWQHESGST